MTAASDPARSNSGLHERVEEMFDILVVGGGPVGLYAAITAARRGLAVAVLEARPGVIDKACGEGLMPSAVAALLEAGVCIRRKRPFAGICYVDGRSRVLGRFAEGAGWGIRRTELHRALRQRADELGIPVFTHRVQEITQDDDGVRIDPYRAHYVLAADGLRSGVRRRLSLQAPPRRRMRRYGLTQHFRVTPWTDFVEVHWHDLGEAYVTPVADDEVGVAFLFDERTRRRGEATVDAMLPRFPDLLLHLQGSARCSSPRGAGPFEQRSRMAVKERVLLIGDAAGYLDPITGEGLRLGFLAATAAIDTVVLERVETYDAAWRRLVRSYWWSTSALLALRGPWLRPLMMATLRTMPAVFRLALGHLSAQPRPKAGSSRPASRKALA